MSLDIRAANFVDTFDISKATVGIIGHGYVGKAVEAFFASGCKVVVHDKAKPELASLADVVSLSELIFVCVPTPMRADGSCYTGIVEQVITNIREKAKEVDRNCDSFVVVIKSTVYPGFTEKMMEKHFDMRIVFSPEFLTEANSIADFKASNRFIVGGLPDDALVVCKYFDGIIPHRVREESTILVQCTPTTAEMVKLYTNAMLMTKVLFCNEIYLICQKLGIDYQDVRMIGGLDKRVGHAHTLVPGPDGDFGCGGHCFPKDLNNLQYTASQLGVAERIFTAVLTRNEEVREKKDWLEMKGRAVIDDQ